MVGENQPLVLIRCSDSFGPEDYRLTLWNAFEVQNQLQAANAEAAAKNKVVVVKYSLEDPEIYFPRKEEGTNDHAS